MLHTKFKSSQPNDSGEEEFLRFLPYRHGRLLGHMTWMKYIDFLSAFAWRTDVLRPWIRSNEVQGELCYENWNITTTSLEAAYEI